MAGGWRRTVAMAVPLLLVACAGTYRATDTVTSVPEGFRCDSILIAVPRDGSLDGKPYEGSGHFVAHRAAEEFSKYAGKVEIAPADLREHSGLLAAARSSSAHYLVVPEIAHWEQRYSAFDHRPSQAVINMSVVEVDSDREIVSTVLDGTSGTGMLVETSAAAASTRVIHDFVRDLCGGAGAS